jgi:hypothetical protein
MGSLGFSFQVDFPTALVPGTTGDARFAPVVFIILSIYEVTNVC